MKNVSLFVVSVILTLAFLSVFAFQFYAEVVFYQNIGGYLKRSADANTIAIASEQLQIALTAIEKQELTQGNTGVLWNTPSTDISFWYKNLKASQTELQSVTSETSLMERTNILMKLRETLLDHSGGESGEEITTPTEIELYPHNKAVNWTGMLTLISATVSWIWWFVTCD